eukprot:9708374-Ditylum_brightwellii.AAC.1
MTTISPLDFSLNAAPSWSLPAIATLQHHPKMPKAPPFHHSPPTEPNAIKEAAAASVSSISNPSPLEHATMDATMDAKGLVSIDTYDSFHIGINK